MKYPTISAYIPCFNNEKTISDVVASIRAQTLWVDDLFVVDDGSTDGSMDIAESLSVRIVDLKYNSGRGTVRARAMEEAKNEFVLSCDAQKALAPDFLYKAIQHFDDDNVAAVYGKLFESSLDNYSQRWRARHLNRQFDDIPLKHHAQLATGACLMRKTSILQVGNFNEALWHSEDVDLGERLIKNGFDIIFDPEMQYKALSRDTFWGLLKRYTRWNSGICPHPTLGQYIKQIAYCTKVMAWKDLKALDPLAALVSLACPHYQYFKARKSEKTGKTNPSEHTRKS